jgi:N-acetylglucosaminyldiphosphoundecaprenol N-acetyl-beta-D-mannosaminyltransferase
MLEDKRMKTNQLAAAVMDISLTHVTTEGLVGAVCERIALRQYERALAVFTPNTEQIVMAHEDETFWRVLEAAEVRVPDSMGLVWADWWRAFVTGRSWLVRERVAGVDAAERLLSEAVERGWKVALIGGADQTATEAALRLKRRFGGLDILGVEVGKVEVGRKKKEERRKKNEERGEFSDVTGAGDYEIWVERETEMVAALQRIKPDVVMVGLGAPKQEVWVMKYRENIPAQVMMVVGGAVEMWAGVQQRAPRWMQRIGFEWLYRLVREPWRIRRQLALVKFVGMVVGGRRKK